MVRLMLAEPFYGHYLTVMNKVIAAPECGDQALCLTWQEDGELVLRCQPEQWMQLTKLQQQGALKHEALHLVLGHVWRRHHYYDLVIFDCAADLVVNQYLRQEQICPPMVTLASINAWLSTLGLPPIDPFLGVDDYYQALLPLRSQLVQSMPELGHNPTSPGSGRLWHQSWQAISQQGDAILKLQQSQWQQHALNAAHRMGEVGCGDLPQELREQLAEIEARMKAQINWRRLLRLFAHNARKTKLKNTLRRPSKRYGTVPGIQVQPLQRILVAVDTSGSVSATQLSQFFDEIYWIWRTGAEIIIVECDVDIQCQYHYRGEPISEVSGRGGTDFNAPIKLANQLRVDALIYFTDGEAAAPIEHPRMPLLWLLHNPAHDRVTANLAPSGRVLTMIA